MAKYVEKKVNCERKQDNNWTMSVGMKLKSKIYVKKTMIIVFSSLFLSYFFLHY